MTSMARLTSRKLTNLHSSFRKMEPFCKNYDAMAKLFQYLPHKRTGNLQQPGEDFFAKAQKVIILQDCISY